MVEQDGKMQPTTERPAMVADQGGVVKAPEPVAEFQSMAELMAQESGMLDLKAGVIVTGTVERIDEYGALVNVGAKSEGLIPPEELGSRHTEAIKVGDTIDVYVVDTGERDGNIILSKKKADYERAWNDIIQAFESSETLTAMVIDRVKGGLVVDLGMRGFLPASHVATKNVNALDRFVGQSVRLKVIEVDRNRKRVVVSQKQAVEEEKKVRRDVTVTSLEEGQIRRGVVRRVTDYGAFVDLGGIDGLLHVTEMSWGRVNHPSDIVKPGQKIDVMVLKYDPDSEKISLGLKQILPDPWQHIDEFYQVGDEVQGLVTRLVPFGAFVALDHGIEGIIPNAELADHRIRKPDDVVAINQKVAVRIINLRPTERRMTLSLRQVTSKHDDEDISTYAETNRPAYGSMTIGEMLGDVFTAEEQVEIVEEVAIEAIEMVEALETIEAIDTVEATAVIEAIAEEAVEEIAVIEALAEDAVEASSVTEASAEVAVEEVKDIAAEEIVETAKDEKSVSEEQQA